MMGVTGIEQSNGSVEYFVVRMVVEERINQNPILKEANVMGEALCNKCKKIDPAHARVANKALPSQHSSLFAYNIADLIEEVKDKFPDTFSVDVYKHFAMQRENSSFASGLKYQLKSLEAMSDTELMAKYLEENSETVKTVFRKTALIEIDPVKLLAVLNNNNNGLF